MRDTVIGRREDRTCAHAVSARIFDVSEGEGGCLRERCCRASSIERAQYIAINLTDYTVTTFHGGSRITEAGVSLFTPPSRVSPSVVGNSVGTEISHFQLNLAESNFTGPMCISGLMHSIPGGPSDELYLHGIILAYPSPPRLPPFRLPRSRFVPSILSLIIRVAPLSDPLVRRW